MTRDLIFCGTTAVACTVCEFGIDVSISSDDGVLFGDARLRSRAE